MPITELLTPAFVKSLAPEVVWGTVDAWGQVTAWPDALFWARIDAAVAGLERKYNLALRTSSGKQVHTQRTDTVMDSGDGYFLQTAHARPIIEIVSLEVMRGNEVVQEIEKSAVIINDHECGQVTLDPYFERFARVSGTRNLYLDPLPFGRSRFAPGVLKLSYTAGFERPLAGTAVGVQGENVITFTDGDLERLAAAPTGAALKLGTRFYQIQLVEETQITLRSDLVADYSGPVKLYDYPPELLMMAALRVLLGPMQQKGGVVNGGRTGESVQIDALKQQSGYAAGPKSTIYSAAVAQLEKDLEAFTSDFESLYAQMYGFVV